MRSYIEFDGRPYNIFPNSYRKVLANPMAAKTSQGSSKFSDQQNWDYFIQDDWSGGIGQESDSGGGTLFAVGDCRWTGRYTLGTPLYNYNDDLNGFALPPGATVQVGSAGTYQKLLAGIKGPPADVTGAALSMLVVTPSADTTITVSLFEMSATCEPSGSALWTANKTVYASNIPGIQIVDFALDWTTSLGSTILCIVIECATSITLGTIEERVYTDYPGAYSKWQAYWDGSAWQKTFRYACASLGKVADFSFYEDARFIRNASSDFVTTYSGAYGTTVHFLSGSGTIPTGYTHPSTDSIYNDSKYYLAYGSDHNLVSTTIAGPFVDMGVKADRIDIGGGYLWRCYDGSIYYSSDSTTWTEVLVGESIIDVRWYNNAPHFITANGLYKVGSGDVPLLLTKALFPTTASLTLWQGRLYISNSDQLIEFDGSSMRDISPMSSSAGLPKNCVGNISSLLGTNTFLYATVNASKTAGGRSGIYAYNGSGWSCMHLFGSKVEIHDMKAIPGYTAYFSLLVLTSNGLYQGIMSEQSGSASFNTSRISPGWLETPWIYGGLSTVEKDWESVFLSYDQPDSTVTFSWDTSVYYKFSAEGSWVSLGTHSFVDEDGAVEFRFPLATRPASNRIKVGVHQLFSESSSTQSNLRLSALRIKYHAMVADRWQWGLSIPVEDDQELLDGSKNPYNQREMRTHLDTLIKQTPPLIYRDIDGTRYEVKILSGNENIVEVRGIGEVPKLTSAYNLTLEMVTTSEYTE